MKSTRKADNCSEDMRDGVDNTAFATQPDNANSAKAARTPDMIATECDNRIYCPHFTESMSRYSETYLIAVKPKLAPANVPNRPTVFWTIPNAPKLVTPRA